MRWWNYLIAYNVSVVAIKTLIQLVGCLVLKTVAAQEEAKKNKLDDSNGYCTIIQVRLNGSRGSKGKIVLFFKRSQSPKYI